MIRIRQWPANMLSVAALVVFAVLSWTSYLASRDVIAAEAQRARAALVVLLIEQTLLAVTDMETTHRGFLLTGDPTFLVPYEEARHRLQEAHLALSAALPAIGRMPAPTIDTLLKERLDILDHNIAVRRSVPQYDPGREYAQYAKGKALMEQLRRTLGALKRQQADELDRRESAIDAAQSRSRSTVVGLSLAGTVLLLVSMWLIARERTRRDRAETRLQALNDDLEEAVTARTREAHLAHDQLMEFVAELDQNVEAERARIARDVHDQCGQIVAAMQMQVERLRRTPGEGAMDRGLDRLLALLAEATVTMRRISAELRPPLLDDLGFAAAIEHHARAMSEQSGLHIEADVSDDDRVTPAQANQLFRIVQEALTNVWRHAGAKVVSIKGRSHDAEYELCIRDDGHGPGEPRPGASGLRNMRERAAMAGGVCTFRGADGGGSEVVVRIPVVHADETQVA